MSLLSTVFKNTISMYDESVDDSPIQRSAAQSYVDYQIESSISNNSFYSREEGSPIRFAETDRTAPTDQGALDPWWGGGGGDDKKYFSGEFDIVSSTNPDPHHIFVGQYSSAAGDCLHTQNHNIGNPGSTWDDVYNSPDVSWVMQQSEFPKFVYTITVKNGYITDYQYKAVFCSRMSAAGNVYAPPDCPGDACNPPASGDWTDTNYCNCEWGIENLLPQQKCKNFSMGKNTTLLCESECEEPWPGGDCECSADWTDPYIKDFHFCNCMRGPEMYYTCAGNATHPNCCQSFDAEYDFSPGGLGPGGDPAGLGPSLTNRATTQFLGGYTDGSGLPWASGNSGPEYCLGSYNSPTSWRNCCNGTCY